MKLNDEAIRASLEDKPRRWNPLHCVPLGVGLVMLVSYMMFILMTGGW